MSDKTRYDDGDEVRCRTCSKPLRKPAPVVYDVNFGAHHPSCRVTSPILCDSTTSESENTRQVCSAIATFWNPNSDVCYCDTHALGLSSLNPITAMPGPAVRGIRERQAKERG